MSEDALREKMAAFAAKKPKGGRKVWQQPVVADFAFAKVLAFDQTFSNTGWASFEMRETGLAVLDHGTLREPSTDLKGFEDSVQRAIWMGGRIATVVKDHWTPGTYVVCERTPVRGFRTESSLLGMYAVWDAVVTHTSLGKPSIVATDHMLSVLCPPDQRYEKRHVTQALNQFTETTRGWNEHNRDALALGLTFLHDRKKAHP